MLLDAREIRKEFAGFVALDGVDFHLKAGEVHALMGENGAGKSTLIKVITGVYQSDGGHILLDDKPQKFDGPGAAVTAGISTVYQEVNLSPNLSVAESICLGREPRGIAGINWKAMRVRAKSALAKLGVTLDVNRPVGSYSVALQQLTAIARAIDVDCKVLILDEPTSSLDEAEVQQLFSVMTRLRDQGMGIVFVTHFLEQVYQVTDRITILRNGTLVGEHETAKLSRLDLVSAMIGRDASELSHVAKEVSEQSPATPIVTAEKIGRRQSVEDVTMTIAPGEIVGLAGLLGSGRTETLRLLYGIDSVERGNLTVGDSKRKLNTFKAIKAGLGLCSEDRKAQGILPELSVRENLMLVVQTKRGWWRRVSRKEQNDTVESFIQRLRIATSDAEKPIQFLSGGNQQKVLLARWLAANPRLLLLDEPTRGIDVGAKFEITKLVEGLREEGMAFAFVSSELDELVRVSTKLVVFRDRKMIGSLFGADVNEKAVMTAIAGDAT